MTDFPKRLGKPLGLEGGYADNPLDTGSKTHNEVI